MSEPSGSIVSLDVLRRVFRLAIDRTSLRQVAREVGISPRGLALFLKGSQPHRATLVKFRNWYARYAPVVVGVSADVAAVSLANLLEGLDGTDREYGVLVITGVVETLHRRRENDPPDWIDGVRRRPV
ncbi:MAG TPA: hypothetical protein VF746_18325 [Longimicrobium sp.]